MHVAGMILPWVIIVAISFLPLVSGNPVRANFTIWRAERTPSHSGVLLFKTSNTSFTSNTFSTLLNVCRRTSPPRGSYKPNTQSAECICKGLGFQGLDFVSNLKSKPEYQFAEKYRGVVGEVVVECHQGEFRVSWDLSVQCRSSYYYTYLACSCHQDNVVTPQGCRRSHSTNPPATTVKFTPEGENNTTCCDEECTSCNNRETEDMSSDYDDTDCDTKTREDDVNNDDAQTKVQDFVNDDPICSVDRSDLNCSQKSCTQTSRGHENEGGETANQKMCKKDPAESEDGLEVTRNRTEDGSPLSSTDCKDKPSHMTLILYVGSSVGGLLVVLLVGCVVYRCRARYRYLGAEASSSKTREEDLRCGGSALELSDKPGFQRVSTCDDSDSLKL